MIIKKGLIEMKVFRMLPRYFRDAIKSVFRNFSLSIASISCIIVTLILVSISMMLTTNVNKATKAIEDDVTIVSFVNNEATEEELKNLSKEVEKMSNVESVEIITKQSKKEELAKESEVYANIVSTWSDDSNPLHDELFVKVKDLSKIGKTAEKIENIDLIDSVKYGEGMVEKMVAIFEGIQNGMVIIVIGLIIVTAFLIANTIKLTIFSRKREIEIMRLVGASNITIKFPFVVEGFVLGLFGSIIPIVFTIYGYNSLYQYFNGQLFTPILKLMKPFPYVYNICGILLIIGVCVGMFGSYRAVRKYLKI